MGIAAIAALATGNTALIGLVIGSVAITAVIGFIQVITGRKI
jgi:hypothetical protein